MKVFKNAYYDHKNNEIHLWSQEIKQDKDGKTTYRDIYEKEKWVPYVFVPVADSEVMSIEGRSVAKKTFRNYFEYNKFCKNTFKDHVFENLVRPEIQFLVERFYKIPDEEMLTPKLKKYFLDIETAWDKGYSKATIARNKINLISVVNSLDRKIIIWGLKPYNGSRKNDVEYRNFNEDEEAMLLDFINFCNTDAPDVWSGWNVYSYDWQYIINRIIRLLGEEYVKKLSPLNQAKFWKSAEEEYNFERETNNFFADFLKNHGGDNTDEGEDDEELYIIEEDEDYYDDPNEQENEIKFDIPGSVILDYLDLYKQYKRKMQENYKLANILRVEKIAVQKLDFVARGFKDLRDLEERDWDLYTDYNIDDADSLVLLDEQMGYIDIVQAICAYAKTPLRMYNSTTQINEGVILTYLRRHSLCAPYLGGGETGKYKAGYVKNPQVGMFKRFIDVDIASSYPTHMIVLNMSIETYWGRIVGMTEEEVVSYVRQRKFPQFTIIRKDSFRSELMDGEALDKFNIALKRGLFAIAPIGSIFTTNREGVLAAVQRQGFGNRKKVKKKMIESKDLATRLKEAGKIQESETEKVKTKSLHALQYAIKVVLNGLYGTTAVQYSRYCNVRISEAITSCGRWSVQQAERFTNELLNNPNEQLNDIVKRIKKKKA